MHHHLKRLFSVTIVLSVLITLSLGIPNITLLGAFDHQMGESSPLVWSGRLVIMETIPTYNPQHQGSCPTDYFIIRDLLSWDIISTIENSCNHAFGNALVTTDDNGIQTMWVFGTLWNRAGGVAIEKGEDTKQSMSPSASVVRGGPCSLGKCASDVFWSTDLKTWQTATAITYPPGMTVYNTDATFVATSPPSLPMHNWIMIIEISNPEVGSRNLFYVKNSSALDGGPPWTLLDPATYFIPNFNTGPKGIGASSSIRFVPQTGYYYVMTGRDNIYIVRSKDLSTWQLGQYNGGTVIKPSRLDCSFMTHAYTAWDPPEETVQLMRACLTWDRVVSDSDMTEVKVADGGVQTLVLYQPNNEAGTGFSNLFRFNGNFQMFFESYFFEEVCKL